MGAKLQQVIYLFFNGNFLTASSQLPGNNTSKFVNLLCLQVGSWKGMPDGPKLLPGREQKSSMLTNFAETCCYFCKEYPIRYIDVL